MSVQIDGSVVRLSGRCGPEDAEGLLVALQEDRSRVVDLKNVQRLHLAVAQVLLAIRPTLNGVPDQPFLARHLANLYQ
jgi:hypothetical protein